MAKGVLYIMSTIVDGLIKLGRTGTANYESRMYQLEHHGYANVTGLKREFAIEVEDYEVKERLLQEIFEKSRIANTELFALKLDVAIALLKSFAGNQVYPVVQPSTLISITKPVTKSAPIIPNGTYRLRRYRKFEKKYVDVRACVKDGEWILQQGSVLAIQSPNYEWPMLDNVLEVRTRMALSGHGCLLEDVSLGYDVTPSFVAGVVLLTAANGWSEWKCANGDAIDVFRKTVDERR